MEDPILWKLDLMSLPWYGNEVSDDLVLSIILVEYWVVGSLAPDFPVLCSPDCLLFVSRGRMHVSL